MRSQVCSRSHSSQARRSGTRLSRTRCPRGLSASLIPRRVAVQSSSVRNTWATLAVMVAASTSSGGSRVASPWIQVTSRRLGAGDLERRQCRIDADDLDAPAGQHGGEGAGPAADVEHASGPELLEDRDVRVEVAAVRVRDGHRARRAAGRRRRGPARPESRRGVVRRPLDFAGTTKRAGLAGNSVGWRAKHCLPAHSFPGRPGKPTAPTSRRSGPPRRSASRRA